MQPRYDESLSILIKASLAEGIDLAADDTVILRNASGRLGIVFKEEKTSNNFSDRLRCELGAYALPEVVLPAALFDVIKSSGVRVTVYPVGDDYVTINLVDRRVVGMDWLADLAPLPEGPPRLVFGSLKGGVGRSTALAVLAADLAQHGRKVLCVDLDLEAPGIGTMLLRETLKDDRRPKYGALDYLVENGLGGVEDDELFDYVGISHFANGQIHVVPAVGRVTDDNPGNMIGKLARGLTEDIGPTGRLSLAVQIRKMVDRFVGRNEYDAVLIDARAGLSETTASTLLGVGARKFLLFAVDQPQTFRGYRYLLSHLGQTLGFSDPNDWRAHVGFVQSKAQDKVSREKFRENLLKLCEEFLYDADEGEAAADPPFNFPFSTVGADVPHDAAYVEYHPTYEAFDPIADGTVLEPEAYRGPFGAFLDRGWEILGLEGRGG